ncbi:MAG: phosphotransferase [Planctomycetia bacterium]|nr:phosphotransferase [Planctomycetia bacterium]
MLHSTISHDILGKYHGIFKDPSAEDSGILSSGNGSRIWKIHGPHSNFCLHRWPTEYPTQQRLDFILAVLWHLREEGFSRVPQLIRTKENSLYTVSEGHFWHLESWLEGNADYEQFPSREKLLSAVTTLAEMHQNLRAFPVEYNRGPCTSAAVYRQQLQGWTESKIENIFDRVCMLECIHGEGMSLTENTFLLELDHSVLNTGIFYSQKIFTSPDTNELSLPAEPVNIYHLHLLSKKILRKTKILRPILLRHLSQQLEHDVALQPCLRNIQTKNLLFKENRLQGILDFGNMQLDNISVDVSQTLSVLAGNEMEKWIDGLNAYQTIYRLTRRELTLVRLLNQCETLLTALKWLNFIYINNLVVECSSHVLSQVKNIAWKLDAF